MANTFNILLFIALILTCFSSISAASRTLLSANNDTATPNGSNFTYVCDPSRYANLGLDMSIFVFCDKTLSYDVRAKDLINQMTLQEKVRQLGNLAYGVPRLGLPTYEWWSEALHGVSNVGPGTFFDDVVPGATSFPTVILSAASFNESLWKSIGQVVSTEARAMYNLGRGGLTYWSPNINVVRDPRWGRTVETPGEDPFVVGKYASNYVRGLQDVEGSTDNYTDLNSRPLKVSSCCKHYTAYDVDKWHGVEREAYDARVAEQDMVETFLRPFEMCVKEGDVSSVMCSFNRVNGVPTCADPKLLNQTIRGDWNLHGYIVSDCDSIDLLVNRHKFLGSTEEDGVALTLRAGLDLDCGVFYPNFTEKAVQGGKTREEYIDRSLKYLYVVLMRLGFFDGNPKYKSLGKDDICTKAHIELAKQAATAGIVLLKNDNNTLPLSLDKFKNLAVVGPHANASEAMIGNYAGVPCKYRSPIDGFSEYVNVNYRKGCDVACKKESLIFPAVQVATKADATIIVVGLNLTFEAEGLDRNDLLLPGYQTRFINQVAASAKGPVVLVIMSGGGVDISFAKKNANINAILWAGYPGEQGGPAIADVVFGQYNPGGKLPITWYENDYVSKLPMTYMRLRPEEELGYPGRTYKFFNGPTVYPFGYGLSYTNFSYHLTSAQRSTSLKLNKYHHCHDLRYKSGNFRPSCPAILTQDLPCEDGFEVELEVKNVGSVDGSETVIVYSSPPEGIIDSNIKQVIGFKKVFVKAGSSATVKFEFNVCQSLKIIDYNAYSLLPSGSHTIVFGDNVVSFPFEINFTG